MKPSWDRLMDEFKDSSSSLVADVDCTVEEELCSQNGVEGYPTIKYGDPGDLQDYQGGREFDDLLSFAKENLGPVCGPKNMELCDDAQKKAITDAQALSDDDLKAAIKAKEDTITAEEKSFSDEVDKLQAKYEELSKAKDSKIAEIRKSGLATLNAVCKDRPSCTPPTPPPPAEDEDMDSEDFGGDDEDLPEDEDMPEEGDDADSADEGASEEEKDL